MNGVVKIVCRLIAISLGIKFFTILPSVFLVLTTYEAQNGVSMLWQVVISDVFYLIIAILFWVLAEPIARIIIGKDSDLSGTLDINIPKLQAGAFSVVGIFTLCTAIPGLVRAVSNVMMIESMSSGVNEASIDFRAQAISYGVQILIGVLLLFGSKGIANIVKMSRDFGIDRAENNKKS